MSSVRYKLTNSNEIIELHKLIIHIGTSPMDDDDHYDNQSTMLEEFFSSPQGSFIREHGSNIQIRDWNSYESWQRRFEVLVELESKKLSEYYLRFK